MNLMYILLITSATFLNFILFFNDHITNNTLVLNSQVRMYGISRLMVFLVYVLVSLHGD